MRNDYTEKNTERKFFFFAVLADRLKAAYGYPSSAVIYREYQGENGPWSDYPDPRPAGDLVVMSVARGGWEGVSGLKHIDQILAEKPDCVVWEYGANEMINGHIDSYVKSTTAAVQQFKAAGIEVVLQTVTPTADLSPHNWLNNKSMPEYGGFLSAQTKRIAQENNCAVADMHAALIRARCAIHGRSLCRLCASEPPRPRDVRRRPRCPLHRPRCPHLALGPGRRKDALRPAYGVASFHVYARPLLRGSELSDAEK